MIPRLPHISYAQPLFAEEAGGGSDHTNLEVASSVTVSGCDGPRVPMVEPTHPRQSYKGAMTHFPSLYRPRLGHVLPQSIRGSYPHDSSRGIHEPTFASGFH